MNLADQPQLKIMMLDYKLSQNPADFVPILQMVDKFVISTMYMLHYRLHQLIGREDPQELYQLAIIALYKACNSMKPETKDLDMRPRIISYIKEEFKNTFRKGRREFAMSTLAATIDPPYIDDTFKKLGLEDFKEQVAKLLRTEILDHVDFAMACSYFGFGHSQGKISEEYKVSTYMVKKRIDRALEVLREHLNAEDFMYE